MLIPAQLQPGAGVWPDELAQVFKAMGSLVMGVGSPQRTSRSTRLYVNVVPETSPVPLRKRKRQPQSQAQAQIAANLIDAQMPRLILDFMVSEYALRVSERDDVAERLLQFPALSLMTALMIPRLRTVFGEKVELELAADTNRLKLFVRLGEYPENILDALADLQESIDPICENAGHRLFLTTDLGTPKA